MQLGNLQASGSTSGIYSTQVSKPRSLNFYDSKDANQDGLVSTSEMLAYSLKHPEVEALKRLRTAQPSPRESSPNTRAASPFEVLQQYGQKGSLTSSRNPGNRNLDLFA